jgi:transcriptional regulator with XRE-family HTH domain
MRNEAASFGERVRAQRERVGLTQAQLAERVGISRVYITQIENGARVNLANRVRERLMDVLGLSDMPVEDESLPPGLADFARTENLPDAGVRALASIHLRGMRPETESEWRMVYNLLVTYLETLRRNAR